MKNASSGVLGFKQSSTYPRGYASCCFQPAALLEAFLISRGTEPVAGVNDEMQHASEKAQRKLNGAGAFIDCLCGRKSEKETSYPRHERGKWPTD
jgi:hypothetical protein